MTSAAAQRPGVMRVLVADDEPDVRETIAEYLALQGFEVLEAANGLETLLQVKRSRPGGIVLDLRMPRLGGLEALKRIRAFDPTITVVVVTAEIDREVLRQASALGAHAVLQKPVVLSDVLAALQSAPGEARAAAVIERAVAPTPDTPQPSSSTRVLIVDDDAEMRELLTEFLSLRGYLVFTAVDGVTAVRGIAEAMPDAVLLDINMPGFSGTDVLPTIRMTAPRAAVIMVSGTTDADLAKRALARGAFDYVVKPIDLNYLAQSLETALAMKALEDAG
jgi:DNA-binding NtrC family response regulator